MKKYLGFICLLYFCIIIYVFKAEKIKYFLSPSMLFYLKTSLIVLFILTIFVFAFKKFKYKFRLSDLILTIPLIMLVFASDCTFSSSFASNRMNIPKKNNKSNETNIEKLIENPLEGKQTEEDENIVESDVNEKAYFEV